MPAVSISPFQEHGRLRKHQARRQSCPVREPHEHARILERASCPFSCHLHQSTDFFEAAAWMSPLPNLSSMAFRGHERQRQAKDRSRENDSASAKAVDQVEGRPRQQNIGLEIAVDVNVADEVIGVATRQNWNPERVFSGHSYHPSATDEAVIRHLQGDVVEAMHPSLSRPPSRIFREVKHRLES
jgi:hypothetical protein